MNDGIAKLLRWCFLILGCAAYLAAICIQTVNVHSIIRTVVGGVVPVHNFMLVTELHDDEQSKKDT